MESSSFMASPSFTQFLLLPSYHSNWNFCPSSNCVQVQGFRLQNKWSVKAVSSKRVIKAVVQGALVEEHEAVHKTSTPAKRGRKKKVKPETLEENSELPTKGRVSLEQTIVPSSSSDVSEIKPRRTRKKALATPTIEEEKVEKKKRGRKPKKKVLDIDKQFSESELSDSEPSTLTTTTEDDKDEDFIINLDGGDDISHLYTWPPLVCCFGAAQHAFVPSGRPANRLIDYELHESMKDVLWAPQKFVRAPGGSAGSVAIALASLGGKVALMGKLGDDEYGQAMLCYLNVNQVQTRSVRVDSKRATAASQMKISKKGLKMTCVKPCAEDYLSKSEINIDVLKEAKMFYFSTGSLLERNMRSTAMQAIKISKQLGSVIFYDLNLPLPLWESSEETKMFIQEAWNSADIIEVTKQELEFLCGINPSEKFDTKDNDKSKFTHYESEVVKQLWHENLKVLFVTNGTSKIHYYTEEDNGAVRGMEDAPITPFTADMSASGDGIVAGLMRLLSVQPELITDKGYLQHCINYAIDCGVIDQWKLSRTCGFPPEDDDDDDYIAPDLNGIRSLTEKEFRTLKDEILD